MLYISSVKYMPDNDYNCYSQYIPVIMIVTDSVKCMHVLILVLSACMY